MLTPIKQNPRGGKWATNATSLASSVAFHVQIIDSSITQAALLGEWHLEDIIIDFGMALQSENSETNSRLEITFAQ